MQSFEEFEYHVRDALAHLYDPTYRPPDALWAVLGSEATSGMDTLQANLIRAVEGMRPADRVPSSARQRRIYELLSLRYVQNLTQKESARRLSITPRHLRRLQREAVLVLAQRLWKQQGAPASQELELREEARIHPATRTEDPLAEPVEWRSQVRQELQSLQRSGAAMIADLGQVLAETVEKVGALTSTGTTRLEALPVRPDIQVDLHPSALRQVLITATRELVQHMPAGQVILSAERKEGRALIEIAGRPAPAPWVAECDLIREILAEGGGTLEFSVHNQRACFSVHVPCVDTVTVLVIDDNVDLVHFYRRYTQGTRYRIAHLTEAARAVETVEASRPDVIVLDVMLPDVDGWQLLTDLHEHPVTRSIPIVLCSVVREEELALALGASLYLPKPVRRQALLHALDQVIGPSATRVRTAPASN